MMLKAAILLAVSLSGATACGAIPKRGVDSVGSPNHALPDGNGLDIRAELSANEASDGSIMLVNVRLPETPSTSAPEITARFEGLEIPVFPASKTDPREYQAVLGVPFNHKPGQYRIQVQVGSGAAQKSYDLPFTIIDGKYPSEVLKVHGSRVNPNKKNLRRIIRESAEIKKLYQRITREKLWSGPFLLPVESRITSIYGTKRVYNGKMRNFHQGVDLKAPIGTPIKAPAPGIVVLSKDLFMTGNTVILDHGYGIFTIYAHMSKLRVKPGQRLDTGALLGLAGMTGRANGPHLHWGAVIHKLKVNPIELTKVMR